MDEREEKILNAFNIARENSYLRLLYGDKQLYYIFLAGVYFGETGKSYKHMLDDDDFVRNGASMENKEDL